MHTGKQHDQGKVGGRQCVCDAPKRVMTAEQQTFVERVRCEKISLHGMCRAVGVSLRWLMPCIVPCVAPWPKHRHGLPVAAPTEGIIGRLEVEADAMGSFVANKANTQGGWIAMAKQPRQMLACHVGARRQASAQQWWANLPAVSRERAIFSTDHYAVYTGIIPAAPHKAITKHARKTYHIERCNHTLRQRVSRLVRETLAFSKKLGNHLGAIQYFIGHDNLPKAAALRV